MRDHSNHIQVSREEAIRRIIEACHFQPRTEHIPVADAAGRVLAEDLYALWDKPNCLTCSMDSVAVRWEDFAQGMPDTSDWVRGTQWEFANTGVAMPEGFDTAIVVEHVIFSENDTKVAFDAMPSGRFAGTSAPGSKMKKGELLAKAGMRVTPLLAAHITDGNVTEIPVIARPRVAFLPTGNELIPAGGEIPQGRNIESNSVMIHAKIRQWGGEVVPSDIVPDQKDALEKALRQAAETADIVVLNAGSSKGNDDWGIEVLEEIGTVFYHQINHGPGHHSSFAVLDGTPVVGISGPPGGAAFTADFYLWPAVMMYLGQNPRLPKVTVRLGEDLAMKGRGPKKPEQNAPARGEDRPKEGGEFYVIRQLRLEVAEDGVLTAFPLGGPHPSPLAANRTSAYYPMLTGPGVKPPAKGDLIEVELIPSFSVI